MINLILKSFIIGLGKIIPGLSGSVLAISFGLYDKGIDAISNFFDDIKENFKFLSVSGLSILSAIVLGSYLIKFVITNFYYSFSILFLIIIIKSIPTIWSNIDSRLSIWDLIVMIMCFLCLAFINLLINNSISLNLNNRFVFIIIGVIDAVTMIIPGISGTAFFMMFNLYNTYLEMLGNIINFNNFFSNIINIIFYTIGLITAGIITSKFINYLFKHHYRFTQVLILSFILSTILVLTFQLINSII